jgi:hypothetical protein
MRCTDAAVALRLAHDWNVVMMQVLKDLNKSSSADLAKRLRRAAAYLNVDDESSGWLGSGLVPKILAILRSLPLGRPPRRAVEVCAAATAVLNNLLINLRTPELLHQFRQLLKADRAASAALVHWGMARPEASENLPPPRFPALRHDVSEVPDLAAAAADHPFWTPFTICCCFLSAMDIVVVANAQYHPQLAGWDVQEAATPGVMERVLRGAIQHPCGAPLRLFATRTACLHACL